jgi:hypothetical protein
MTDAFMMKRLGNLINDEYYDLPERYAPSMLDMGYVEFLRKGYRCFGVCYDMSYYEITDKGRKAYKEWLARKL